MRKTTFYCDRCGKLITKSIYQLSMFTGDPDTAEEDWTIDIGADLCAACFKIVDQATANAIRNKQDPEKTTAPKTDKPKGKAKTWDVGKMKALRNAGWTYEKIADEFGCTDQTVINQLRAAAEREREEVSE